MADLAFGSSKLTFDVAILIFGSLETVFDYTNTETIVVPQEVRALTVSVEDRDVSLLPEAGMSVLAEDRDVSVEPRVRET